MFDFVAIDFETANHHMNSACSVGLVGVSGNNIVKSDYFLIKPPTDNFEEVNFRINGITYEMVKNEKIFPDVYPEILNYIKNTRIIIAHNAVFDMSVLNDCLEYYLIERPEFIYIDSINFSSQVKCDCGNSLEDCANYFNIDLLDHHNALCDAEVCAKIILESIKMSDANSLAEYVLFYPDVQRKRFSELNPYHFISHKTHKKKTPHYISPSSITTTNKNFDKTNPFYEKNCVLTGELTTLSRHEAMQKIVDAGGIVKSSVSSKTDYLILGVQDKEIVGADGLSTKQRKAYSLIEKGVEIKIIEEDAFLNLLS